MVPKSNNSKRNIVFFGETGTGKSSAINLLLEPGVSAPVSNDSQPCTQAHTRYETTLNDAKYTLWDTRGLGGGRSIFRAIFGGSSSSEKGLKKFLQERRRNDEIDLLVYCVRGSRANKASVKYYNDFCAITRRLVAPVVIVVTHLDKEKDRVDWWNNNSSSLKELKMEFDDHVCITTLTGDLRLLAESKKKLADLITKNRPWEAQDSGDYLGYPVQKPTPFVPPPKGGIWSLFKVTGKVSVDDESPNRRPRNYSGLSSCAPSPTDSSYHTATADSPPGSIPPSPVVESPTPRSATSSITVPHIHTNLLRASDPPHSSSGESMGSSLHSMFQTSSDSSHSEVYLESCTEEHEDYLSELPFRHSTAAVRRRRNYATRSGAFGDIWECDLIEGESSRMVAVKSVKTNTSGHEDLKSHEKKLDRELKVWGRLRHRNVVPLLGVVSGFGPLPSAVSPWFRNGSLSCYLADHQRSRSEKHRLLGDIAVGLCYLHSQDVVHGDLHSGNVLVDDDGTACLTDFGLSLISDFVGTSYLKSGICGGVQFADPALVQRAESWAESSQGTVFYPTKPCDIYSFGGVMLHILSGKKPYNGIPQASVFWTVLRGERPQIPTHDKHITHWHTSLIRKCWDQEEHKRPSADDLVRRFDRQ